ncbi:acyl dehydratase [Limnobacter thiooxidans]|uniref:MaoC/PaaZ C-terminal domain-containing protein n=1 Tax=Limnobacter thiooxidans TaxID=131080 RepID=A0AA86J7W4_9BURK|nr:acyl dehydratase [Limnobacter thiooxidans]BET26705.1 MaoC/PaaZ C-terminal domain-containing protein [Limnobacter thiooxidans]
MLADYPLKYLALHWPNIRSMGWAAIRNATPLTRPGHLPELPVHLDARIGALNNELVDQYAAWAGAPAQRYAKALPPHFCSHWAMPMLAKLGSLAPYNLLSLLNQGLRMQIHQPLQRDDAIALHGSLMEVSDDGDKVRIHTRVQASNPKGELAVVIDSYSTVPRGKPASKSKPVKRDEFEFNTVGQWHAEEEDGLAFAMLTGDFNPIHTLKAVGKRTRFKSCILHGFGQLARTWEVLHNASFSIADIDVRWIKPLPLPNSGMQVQVSAKKDSEGYTQLRVAAADGTLHMVGRFK